MLIKEQAGGEAIARADRSRSFQPGEERAELAGFPVWIKNDVELEVLKERQDRFRIRAGNGDDGGEIGGQAVQRGSANDRDAVDRNGQFMRRRGKAGAFSGREKNGDDRERWGRWIGQLHAKGPDKKRT